MRRTLLLSGIGILLLRSFLSPALGQNPEPNRIAPGTPWETEWFDKDSGTPGPTVLVIGGIHGDEPAGARAADQIRHWPVVSGRLVILPRANPVALDARERRIPGLPKEESDLNRNFPRTGAPDEARSEPAQALWAFVKDLDPDWVLDLHEGFDIHRQNPKSVGSSILCRPDDATRPHFEHALAAVNASIEDPEKRFLLKDATWTADGSLVRASMQRLGAVGAILETTYEDQPIAVRMRQHRLMVHRILKNLGMIENGPDDLVFREPDDRRLHIAIYEDGGVFGSGPSELWKRLQLLSEEFEVRTLGGAEVREGKLEDFDAVLFPGGSGSRQGASLGAEGRERVREFIEDGGGFLGICGGCYLACENFSWGLKVLDARTKSSRWRRGRAYLDLDFSADFAATFDLDSPPPAVRYANGPVMEPAASPDIPDFEVVATFATEVAENDTPAGIQVGSPAILRGTFGNGRVVGISPHPESSDGLRQIVPEMLRWLCEAR